MPYISKSQTTYRDIQTLDLDSGSEASARYIGAPRTYRALASKRAVLAAFVALAAVACLLVLSGARTPGLRAKRVAGVMNFDEEGGVKVHGEDIALAKDDKISASSNGGSSSKKSGSSSSDEAVVSAADTPDAKDEAKDEAKGSTADTSSGAKDDIVDSVADSPSQKSGGASADAQDEVKDKAKEAAKGSAADASADAQDEVKDEAKEAAKGSAADASADAKDKAKDSSKAVQGSTSESKEEAAEGPAKTAAAATPCMEESVAFHPLDMKDQALSYEKDAEACHRRCAAVDGCEHFTFFPADRSCHIQDGDAVKVSNAVGSQAGTRECEEMLVRKL